MSGGISAALTVKPKNGQLPLEAEISPFQGSRVGMNYAELNVLVLNGVCAHSARLVLETELQGDTLKRRELVGLPT
jgi:hypothetical protein